MLKDDSPDYQLVPGDSMGSVDVHQNLKIQLLSDSDREAGFSNMAFDLLIAELKEQARK